MLDIFELTVPALTGDEPRNIYVYKPDAEGTFPVLYMFDGHNVFLDETATYGKSWGMLEYLQNSERQLIVVGIECSHHDEREACGGRLSEYSPFDFTFRRLSVKGRGKLTMDWIVQELMPYINAHYPVRTGRDHTFIAGSSMGGLMTFYALSAYNDIFSRGAALSPAFGFSKKDVLNMIRNTSYGNTVLYMDAGELELNRSGRRIFGQVSSLLVQKGILLNSRIVPGGLHNEASWERQIPFFMNTLFYHTEEPWK